MAVCGKDGIFLPAAGTISGNDLLVRCDAVAEPKQICLGKSNFFQLILYNNDGFIAAPFIANIE